MNCFDTQVQCEEIREDPQATNLYDIWVNAAGGFLILSPESPEAESYFLAHGGEDDFGMPAYTGDKPLAFTIGDGLGFLEGAKAEGLTLDGTPAFYDLPQVAA